MFQLIDANCSLDIFETINFPERVASSFAENTSTCAKLQEPTSFFYIMMKYVHMHMIKKVTKTVLVVLSTPFRQRKHTTLGDIWVVFWKISIFSHLQGQGFLKVFKRLTVCYCRWAGTRAVQPENEKAWKLLGCAQNPSVRCTLCWAAGWFSNINALKPCAYFTCALCYLSSIRHYTSLISHWNYENQQQHYWMYKFVKQQAISTSKVFLWLQSASSMCGKRARTISAQWCLVDLLSTVGILWNPLIRVP